MATIDVLGEEISTPEAALEIVGAYHDVFEAIEIEHLDSNVRVKLTGLGLTLGYDLCKRNLQTVVRHAAESGNFVRIDMEDSSCTSDTLRMYKELREEGLDNVGVVLQAYLRRTIRGIRELAPLRPNIRLCKGIYIEPPLIAYRDFDAVRENFVLCLRELLRVGSYVGIATHDQWLISEGKRLVDEHGLQPEEFEFQMLFGVTPAAGDRLIREGHRLRVYVPSASTGTATRCGDCRRIRRSRATSRGTRSTGCSVATARELLAVLPRPARVGALPATACCRASRP